MRHILSVEVENTPGVLARVASLFSARGYNIESLAVGQTEAPERSRMTIVVDGDDRVIEQIRKQLIKLIDTIKVVDLTGEAVVERDLALVKLRVPGRRRQEVAQMAELFRARVVDVAPRHMIVEISGREEKIAAFLDLAAAMGRESLSGDAGTAESAGDRAAARAIRRRDPATGDGDRDGDMGGGGEARDAPAAYAVPNGGRRARTTPFGWWRWREREGLP